MSAWTEGRPIFKRLPQYGWQDQNPPISDWVTDPFDRLLIRYKNAIANIPNDFFNPDTARADALDWLAQLMGYTGEYWDTEWPDPIKRQLIKDAQFVWSYKGTQQLLEYLFSLFKLDVLIEVPGSWRVGITAVGSSIGGDLLSYSLLINSTGKTFYIRTSDQWRLIERLNRLFMPCWCSPISLKGSFVHYDRFRVGLSAVGEPI